MACVLWHVTMSLVGFVAAPGDRADFMLGFGEENDEVNWLLPQIGAILSRRHSYNVGPVEKRLAAVKVHLELLSLSRAVQMTNLRFAYVG